MTAPNPIPQPKVVTIRQAAATLGFTEHHIRRLIREGKLQATGEGSARRITADSLEKYRVECKKDGHFADIRIPMSVGKEYDQTINEMLQTFPALWPPHSAARLLKFPRGRFEELVRTGGIPSIAVGSERFVPARWVAETYVAAFGGQHG